MTSKQPWLSQRIKSRLLNIKQIPSVGGRSDTVTDYTTGVTVDDANHTVTLVVDSNTPTILSSMQDAQIPDIAFAMTAISASPQFRSPQNSDCP